MFSEDFPIYSLFIYRGFAYNQDSKRPTLYKMFAKEYFFILRRFFEEFPFSFNNLHYAKLCGMFHLNICRFKKKECSTFRCSYLLPQTTAFALFSSFLIPFYVIVLHVDRYSKSNPTLFKSQINCGRFFFEKIALLIQVMAKSERRDGVSWTERYVFYILCLITQV